MEVETLVHLIDQCSSSNEKARRDASRKVQEFLNVPSNLEQIQTKTSLDQAASSLDSMIKQSLTSITSFLSSYELSEQDLPLSAEEQQFGQELVEIEHKQTAIDMLWVIRSAFQEINALCELGELSSAIASVDTLKSRIDLFSSEYPGTTIVNDLSDKAQSVSSDINKKLDKAWENSIIFTDINNTTVLSVVQSVGGLSLSTIYETIQMVDTGKFYKTTRTERLLISLDKNIIEPMLEGKFSSASIEDGELILGWNMGTSKDRIGLEKLIAIFSTVVNFLNSQFEPSLLSIPISQRFSHGIIIKIISSILPVYFPEDPTKLPQYKQDIIYAVKFEQNLNAISWTKSFEIEQWAENCSSEWIRYRKGYYLNSIREILNKDMHLMEMEVESQLVAPQIPLSTTKATNTQTSDEWGWDNEDFGDDDNEVEETENGNKQTEEDWGDDNWGWGDEQKPAKDDPRISRESVQNQNPQRVSVETIVPKSVGRNVKIVSTTIDNLLEIISRFLFEIEDMGESAQVNQVSDLANLFRVLAPTLYQKRAPSIMIQYNDMIQLHERMSNGILKDIIPSELLLLKKQSDSLLSQILHEPSSTIKGLLEKTDHFRNCSEQQKAPNTSKAVNQAVQYILEIFSEWKKYGSYELVAELAGKLIEQTVSLIMLDIQNLGDIAEEESYEISKILQSVTPVEQLFPADDPSIGNFTAHYVPSWIKFQYFNEILQSSLVDITYLLNHNALVDFTGSELTSLITALFAPSEKRDILVSSVQSSSRL